MAEFRGVTVAEFHKAFDVVNAEYAGNLIAYDVRDTSGPKKGPAVTFRLKVKDNGPEAKGARGGYTKGSGPNGLKRTSSACWHAWYDVFGALATAGIDQGWEVRTLATPESGFRWYESDPTMGVTNFLALMDGSNMWDGDMSVVDRCACEDDETHTYRVEGTYGVAGNLAHHSILVTAKSPEHAEKRVKDFFDSPVGTLHEGIRFE